MAIDSGCSTEKVAMSSIPSMVRILAVDDHPQLREGLVPPHTKRVSVALPKAKERFELLFHPSQFEPGSFS